MAPPTRAVQILVLRHQDVGEKIPVGITGVFPYVFLFLQKCLKNLKVYDDVIHRKGGMKNV